MKSSLTKLFDEQGCNRGYGFWAVRIKEESINMASQHPQRWRFNRGRGNFGFHSGQNRFSRKSGSNKFMVKKEEELIETLLVLLVGKGHHLTHVM